LGRSGNRFADRDRRGCVCAARSHHLKSGVARSEMPCPTGLDRLTIPTPPPRHPWGKSLKTASSGEGPSPFRSLPNVMRARAFADERGLAMGGGRPTERWFTVGGSGKSVARCHRMVLAYWKFESISLQRRVYKLSVPGRSGRHRATDLAPRRGARRHDA
jgi:hypothetical protein